MELNISGINPIPVLEFAPGDSPWNSQAHMNLPFELKNAQFDEVTICYRIKIFRFLPSIYWLNIIEYRDWDENQCCQMRSCTYSTA